MPSTSLQLWIAARAKELEEMEQAHVAIGGTGPGRRRATQQVNRAFAVLLASHFQGFCRDLHSECSEHIVSVLSPPPALRLIVRAEFSRGRMLDRQNAHPGSIGADFGRFGITFWEQFEGRFPAATVWKRRLIEMNDWRNAIVHQDFDKEKLGGTLSLQLQLVRQWRTACQNLATNMDKLMKSHLGASTGSSPW